MDNKTDIQILAKQKAGVYFVEVPIPDGFIHFEFSEFEFSSHNQDCIIYCWVEVPGHTQDGLTQRINLLSGSARSDFVRQLGFSFGKIANWNLIFSNVCSKVVHESESVLVAKSYSDFEIDNKPDILKPFLRNNAVTVFFGMGSSGKTLLALELGLCVAYDLPFLGHQPQETGNFLFIDYEDSHQTFFERISALAADRKIDPQTLDQKIFRFEPQSRPIHDIKNALKKEIIKKQIKLVVVDSALNAAGGTPESAEVAGRLFGALKNLDVCVLLICHKTKSEEGDKYPFGSIYFYNYPRNIWYVKKDDDLGEELTHVGLIHRKCNYDRKSLPKGVKIDFTPSQITITEESNFRWGEDLGIKQRILNSLGEGPKSVENLSRDLDIPKERLKPRLTQLQNQGKIKRPEYAGKWEISYPIEIG